MTDEPVSRDLSPNVRRIIDEIENEIGDHDGDALVPTFATDDAGGAANGGIEAAVRRILLEIGEDPTREGLVGTPDRMHRMYHELTAGYHVDPERLINKAIFEV